MDYKQVKNIRLKKEINELEKKSEYHVNSIIGNSKYYTGFVDPTGKNVDYTVNVSLNLYNYIDDYIDCELYYLRSYPFKQPDCKINGNDYREVLYRLNGERYKDEEKYGIILKKYINYGFKSCPCCESIFYKNQNNFILSMNNYLDEIKRVLLCKYNKDRLIIIRNILLKKIGIEFESVYEYLVGKI
tara:strand:- start:752 stop:1312 length:561 start_codon:yes stop_codon:yes gene_type:complete